MLPEIIYDRLEGLSCLAAVNPPGAAYIVYLIKETHGQFALRIFGGDRFAEDERVGRIGYSGDGHRGKAGIEYGFDTGSHEQSESNGIEDIVIVGVGVENILNYTGSGGGGGCFFTAGINGEDQDQDQANNGEQTRSVFFHGKSLLFERENTPGSWPPPKAGHLSFKLAILPKPML
jgi:hypothetical protein